MPPWKADEGPGGGFIGQARLTTAERDLIARWVADGAPEGNPRDLPPVPAVATGWQAGTPDLVVPLPAFALPADGTDVFRIFVVPLTVGHDRIVRGLEFRPGNARVVHHANIRIDRTAASRRFDDADPAPGYEGLIAHSATFPDGYFLGWTPGQVSPLLPAGLGWHLPTGTDLVVEVHMQPSGRTEEVQPSVGLYFGEVPPSRTPTMIRLGRQSIDIAPGDAQYEIEDRFVLPVDAEIQAVQPHAHYRAREVWGTATLPDGTSRSLIHVGDWDFRWQHVFRYVAPMRLPKGTTLSMRYVFDNSAENPRNPIVPPRRVFWGQRSADEMGDLWIQVLTGSERDRALLEAPVSAKVMAEDVIGYERMIQSEPRSAALHDDVGILYLRLNRPDPAVRHFAISAGLQPTSPSAHFNLATALTIAQQPLAAVREYQRALELNPSYAHAHNNLGALLTRLGRVDEAMPHLNDALRLAPSDPQSLYNLGIAAEAQRRYGDAIGFFTRAVEAQPESAPMLASLAWLLATSPADAQRDAARALTFAEQAVSLSGGQDPAALDALAAAAAAAGDFDRALRVIDAALQRNPADPDAVAARRALYAARQPYRLP